MKVAIYVDLVISRVRMLMQKMVDYKIFLLMIYVVTITPFLLYLT
jgi:hypothetical protein